jgi:ketosteroid isomerase-like protein
MDAHDSLAARGRAATARPNLAAIEQVWKLLGSSGPLAAAEQLMELSHDDVEVHSYMARGAASPGQGDAEVMRGAEEILSFHRKAQADGVSLRARAKSFEIEGDSVVVRGTARVVRPDGSFAETKLSWQYRFRDGLVDKITWTPRAGE